VTVDADGAARPFRPSAEFDLGIRGGPVLPAAIVGRDVMAEPLAPDGERYCLIWSPVTPSGQKVALAAVLHGLLDRISVLVPNRGRLEADPDAEGGFRWSARLTGDEERAVAVGTSVRTPTLVDAETATVVSNDPYLLPYAFRELARGRAAPGGLLPTDGDPDLERLWDARIFDDLHVAAYRAGFVTTQELYEEAAGRVHRFLFDVDGQLGRAAFLLGDRLSVSDLWLFSLLVRFDQVYGPGFRLHRYRIRDFPNVRRYLRDLFAVPACAFTTDFAAISEGYYLGIPALNRNVVPIGPDALFIHAGTQPLERP
jgi:glutathionyl-hydroquinone reductase